MTAQPMSPAAILALPMRANDAGADTVGDYLTALLSRLWEYGDGFSGKRPFGESDWHHHLYRALIDGAVVETDGKDEDYPYPANEALAYDLIQSAITALVRPTAVPAAAAA